MTDKTLRLLMASDHPSAGEAPPGFNRSDAMRQVKALVPALERIIGRELSLEHVEDASHFTAVACYRDAAYERGIGWCRTPVIRIVFSSFGRLFTVLSAEDVAEAQVVRAISVVTDAGFTFVPAEDLDEPYTGVNPHRIFAGTSWFRRFFDYL